MALGQPAGDIFNINNLKGFTGHRFETLTCPSSLQKDYSSTFTTAMTGLPADLPVTISKHNYVANGGNTGMEFIYDSVGGGLQTMTLGGLSATFGGAPFTAGGGPTAGVPAPAAYGFRDITDGTSNTLLASEAAVVPDNTGQLFDPTGGTDCLLAGFAVADVADFRGMVWLAPP